MGLTLSSSLGGPGGSLIIPPYFADFMRANLYPNLYLRQLGTMVTIPRGYGYAVKIPRWKTPIAVNALGEAGLSSGRLITAITENLTEGTTVTKQAMSAESISGSTVQFGGARGYSDKLILVSHANFVEGALESLARELSFRIDRYSKNKITANADGPVDALGNTATVKCKTTSVLNGKANALIAPRMDTGLVPRWPDQNFVGITHPLAQYDIFNDISTTGFISVARYNDAARIYRGEIGQMYGIRWLLSGVMLRKTGTAAASATNGISPGATATNALVFAPDAFYVLEQQGGGMEIIHHPPGSSGSVDDALNQIGSIGVKVHYGVLSAPAADKRLLNFVHGYGLTY